MLTYLDVHLMYTLPVVAALASVTWPFVGRLEKFKIAFVCAMAFAYTTPWDNYIIYHDAWTYSPENIWAVVGYVPVEEYGFFVIQTAITSLWAVAVTRWSPGCFSFNHDRSSYRVIRWVPIAGLTAAVAWGYAIAVPGSRTFYLGCILWWSCPVIAFLWYGAGNYFVKKSASTAIAVVAPTAYLCWVDRIALRDGVWHINERTSLNVFPADDLPLEECLFFLITNVIIVLGGMAFDKSYALMDTYPADFPLRYGSGWPYVRQQIRAFATAECEMPIHVVDDVRQCADVLRAASKSFNMASLVFPAGVRLDLIVLYAFCRVTDDMIDNEPDADRKRLKLVLIKRFVDQLFADRDSDYDVKTAGRAPHVDWAQYRSELSAVELSCFRAITRIAFYLPRKPFYELIDGYKWDVDGKTVQDETDLLLYSNYVAGSVGALCVYVMIHKSGATRDSANSEINEFVIKKAYQMGQVLQIVNISRDIATDSEALGRCYVPVEYMDEPETELKTLRDDRKPWTLGDKKLKKYASRMIKLTDRNQRQALEAVSLLPYEVRGPVLVATNIYRGVATVIEASSSYPKRASLGNRDKILVAIVSLYFRSLKFFLPTKMPNPASVAQ